MKKMVIASLALILAGCGPSEEEIRAKAEAEKKSVVLKNIEKAKLACSELKTELGCSYKVDDNYHIFHFNSYDFAFGGFVSKILVEPLDLPPNVIAKLNATSAVMGLQEESMDGAKVSWDIDVETIGSVTAKSITFNVIL